MRLCTRVSGVSQPFGYGERPTDRRDNGRLLARTPRQSDGQAGSEHPHTAASVATLMIKALTSTNPDVD